ncbi:hypothetical protein SESBI_25607 [Sesbania bispinosa]|nr:hypothetical protein SESBI_25607 [Sesbania bispinosa]
MVATVEDNDGEGWVTRWIKVMQRATRFWRQCVICAPCGGQPYSCTDGHDWFVVAMAGLERNAVVS